MSIEVYRNWLSAKNGNKILNNLDKFHLEERLFAGNTKIPRLTSWFATNGEPYVYSRQSTPASPFNKILTKLVDKLYRDFGYEFNSCLANYYRDGNDSVSWHKDDEYLFIEGSMIASLSLGATRTFELKATDVKFSYDLNHGDLIMFDKEHKEDFVHRIKKQPKIKEPRLNLTFRILK